MAVFRHPETGVILNVIEVHRARLSEAEEETAKLLRRDGHKVHDIAAMLGTNAGRVQTVLGLTGKVEGPHGTAH